MDWMVLREYAHDISITQKALSIMKLVSWVGNWN